MDKLMFVAGIGGLYWALHHINKPTTINTGVAIGSMLLLNVSISSMVSKPKQQIDSVFTLQK